MTGRQVAPSPPPPAPGGREAQRRRTRRAIVEATRELVRAGGTTPTVDAVAAAADVSRRTVYMHFPTLDQLLLDATLGALTEAYVDSALERADETPDVHARVEALVHATLGLSATTLPLGRQIIRLTIDHDESRTGVRRGQRRIAWIESALEPVADALTEEQHERLVSGLAMLIGFEAMVVLRDVRGLDLAVEARVTTWAAMSLVDAMLAEAAG